MKASKVVRSKRAQADFRRLYAWIAIDSGHARAAAVLARIDRSIERLALRPRIGRARKDYDGEPHAFTVAPWLIVYEILPEHSGIHVLRILDSRRDIAALMGKKS